MLERLIALLTGADTLPESAARGDSDRLSLAAAALLVVAARLDGRFDSAERRTIEAVLQAGFGLDAHRVAELIGQGEQAAQESTQLFAFTRVINDRLDPDKRVKIIEMLWEVVYADGEIHDYEANLVRRVAGLLYVPDRDSGEARQRVIQRLQATGTKSL